MALWGKTDNLAGAPKYIARAAYIDSTAVSADDDTIPLTNIGLSTGDAVAYSIGEEEGTTAIGGLTDGTTYYIRAVEPYVISLYDTQAHALAGGATGKLDITDEGVGTHTLTRTGAANINDHNNNGSAILFVDRVESQIPENRAKGLRSPGWWLHKTWTNADGSVQHRAEHLVAMDVLAATSGDASDDQVVPDKGLSITNPANATIVDGANGTFATTATTIPAGGSLTYLWQVSTDTGATWSTVSNGGIYSGATTATLALTAPAFAVNGNQYRVTVSGTGYATKVSAAATLTITPVTIEVTDPTDQTAAEGASGTFGPVVATTDPVGRTVTYQWQVSDDAGDTWADVTTGTGGTTDTFVTAVTVYPDDDQLQFRVVVSRAGADDAVSAAATLTVTDV